MSYIPQHRHLYVFKAMTFFYSTEPSYSKPIEILDSMEYILKHENYTTLIKAINNK